jgi:hypothetical protein
MFTFTDALILACEIHEGQKDLGGEEYIKHPLHVYNEVKIKGGNDDVQITAILHDVFEDGNVEIGSIENIGCPEPVCKALRLLTHKVDKKDFDMRVRNAFLLKDSSQSMDDIKDKINEEYYFEYIKNLRGNDLGSIMARTVKIEDLRHNSDISRFVKKDNVLMPKKDSLRLLKYEKALRILNIDDNYKLLLEDYHNGT